MTTGDAHAKKRIEKKKKKGEPTEEIVLRHGPPSSPQAHVADHRNLHVYKDRATGGGVCAKSVFFVLAILIALVLAFSMSGFQGQTGGDVAKTDSSLEGRIIRGIHHRSRGYDEDDDDDLEHSEEVDEDDGDDENEEEEEEEDEDDDETEAESEDEDESDENAEEEEDVEDNTEDASDVEEESVERETAEEDVADEEKSEEDEVEVASEDEDEATVDTEEDDENGRDYEENEPDEEEPEISGKVKKRAWTFRKIEPYRTDGDERTKPKNAEDEEIVPRTKLRRDFAKHDEERSKMREVKLDVRKPRGDFGKPKKNGRGRQDDDERNLKAEEAESTGEAEGKAPKLDLQKLKKDFIGIRPTFGKPKKNAVSIEKDEEEGDDDERDVEDEETKSTGEEEEEKKTPKLDLKKLKKDIIDIRPTFGKPKRDAVSIEKDEDEGDDDEQNVEDEESKSTGEEEEEEKKTPKLDLKKLKKDFIDIRPTFGKPKKNAVSIEKDEDEGDHDEQNLEDEEGSKSTGEGEEEEEEEEGKKAPKLDLKKLKKDFISVRPTFGKPKKNAVSIEKDEDEGDDDEQHVEDVTGEELEEEEDEEEEKKAPKLDLKKLKRDFVSVKPGFGKLKKSVALVGKKEDADGGDDADELEEEEDSEKEDDLSEQKLTRTEVAIKFGVGIAIFVTAYVVLVRKWKTDKFDGSAKGEEPDVSKTNTLVPPPTLQEVERDIEDFEGEEYSDRDDARPHAPSSRQHYEELRARYARTLTPNSEEDASERSYEEYEEEEYDDDEEIDSVEEEELSEEEDYEEELLEKLERRYGKRASVSSEDYDEEDDEEYERKRRG